MRGESRGFDEMVKELGRIVGSDPCPMSVLNKVQWIVGKEGKEDKTIQKRIDRIIVRDDGSDTVCKDMGSREREESEYPTAVSGDRASQCTFEMTPGQLVRGISVDREEKREEGSGREDGGRGVYESDVVECMMEGIKWAQGVVIVWTMVVIVWGVG